MATPSPASVPLAERDVVVKVEGLQKYFGKLHVLKGVDMDVRAGEVVVIFGRSGSGKSTLLRCVNFLEDPTHGSIEVAGIKLEGGHRTKNKREQIRKLRTHCGMVFQQFNLFPHMTVIENVIEAPIRVKKQPEKHAQALGLALLEKVGLADKADQHPIRLSGGQQQRVAIARALINDPKLMLADEPTGNLDTKTSEEVMGVFQRLNDDGKTVLVITHETDISEYARRIVVFRDGRIVEDRPVTRRRQAARAH